MAIDFELLLAFAILAAFIVVLVFERRAKAARARAAAAAPPPHFSVVVKAPQKYASPVDAALRRENLGEATGSEAGVSVKLTNRERGLPFLKRELLRLGAQQDTRLEFVHFGTHVAESLRQMELEAGMRYRVIKAFTDHDRDVHPLGEEWTFLRSSFVPYHSGMSWFVSFDGVEETHIRLQSIPQEQGEILDNLADYLVAL